MGKGEKVNEKNVSGLPVLLLAAVCYLSHLLLHCRQKGGMEIPASRRAPGGAPGLPMPPPRPEWPLMPSGTKKCLMPMHAFLKPVCYT